MGVTRQWTVKRALGYGVFRQAGHQSMCRRGRVPVQSVRGRAARVDGWHRHVY